VTHNTKTEPARTRFHSSDLSCDVVRTYAYRARCACGWESPKTYASYDEARAVAREHRLEKIAGLNS